MARHLYIDGEWVKGSTGQLFDVVNPATEEVIDEVPQASLEDVERAVLAARRSFDDGVWSRRSPKERAAVLGRVADAVVARKDEIIDTVVAEVGTPRTLAEGLQVAVPMAHLTDMVERVLPTFEFSRPMPPTFGAGIGQGVVLREPAGVVAALTPFNYPFFVNISKVAPSLAAGCSVVLKPAPTTPLSALLIADIIHEAGLPRGVLNVVTGDVEAGQVLTGHPAVDVVTFTGSVPVGAEISRQAAATVKRVVLELGGKNACVILDDADLERAVGYAAYGSIRNSGQGCGCISRILAHDSIYDEVVERLVETMAGFTVGDPTDPGTDMGPLITDTQRARVERYVGIGVDEGARLAFGGGRPERLERGYYVQPTVLADVKSSATVAQEEIFGPVASVISFSDDAEATSIANDSVFGLTGAVWSGDPLRAFEMAKSIRTGQVVMNGGGGGVNPHGPYGGYKQSGIGREFGEAGLNEYLETKAVMWGVAGG